MRNGASVPVVTQGNKAGNLFVLHRQTGKSVFGVEERPVPASDAEGEQASPTQPFPLAPPPFAPQRLTADDAGGRPPRTATPAAPGSSLCDPMESSRRRALVAASPFRAISAA
jgi:glucose dehydrogenase